mmetsp:Transcript_1393/g.3789  ORF Transcript_1393/g.3789 Transcript_1393/m.3789 type:complete len:308 (-) Transcript_1393:2145-3068(-)
MPHAIYTADSAEAHLDICDQYFLAKLPQTPAWSQSRTTYPDTPTRRIVGCKILTLVPTPPVQTDCSIWLQQQLYHAPQCTMLQHYTRAIAYSSSSSLALNSDPLSSSLASSSSSSDRISMYLTGCAAARRARAGLATTSSSSSSSPASGFAAGGAAGAGLGAATGLGAAAGLGAGAVLETAFFMASGDGPTLLFLPLGATAGEGASSSYTSSSSLSSLVTISSSSSESDTTFFLRAGLAAPPAAPAGLVAAGLRLAGCEGADVGLGGLGAAGALGAARGLGAAAAIGAATSSSSSSRLITGACCGCG